MDFESNKMPTFEYLKDEDYRGTFRRVIENQDINVCRDFLDFCSRSLDVMGDFLDKETVKIDYINVITDFMDFWANASCWFKENLGLTVEDENERRGTGEDEVEKEDVEAPTTNKDVDYEG